MAHFNLYQVFPIFETALEKSSALLETENALLKILGNKHCTVCQNHQALASELLGLDDTAQTLGTYSCDLDLDDVKRVLEEWAGDARATLEALLEKCPDCANLPAGAKELIAECRQNLKPVVEQENPGQDPEPALA